MTSFMKEFEHLKIQLEEIKRATNSFRNQVIGAGGFGQVYEGEVSHSMGRRSIVAIKRLNRKFGQGDPEFLKEILFLSRYMHQNLVSLLGFCDEEDEKVLVYEFASKGSLDRRLSDIGLTWLQRIKICLGAAKGLCYLHDPKGTHQRVIHCDIKSANILLDESLTAKVADFGLSKMGPANQQYSVVVTNALGTPGYCDPLFMTTYTLTKESDVYSFGVVLFEVLCGRLCYEHDNGQVMVFVNMWKEKYSENKLNEIVFQHLKPQMDPTSLKLFSEVAFRCLDNSREGRPTMYIVVEKLEKALECQELYDLKLPDCKTHKVVVKGEKADPLKVLERVQKTSHRKVELLSPIPKPPAEEPKAEEKQPPKPEEKKEEPPQVITVVLQVNMHCEDCAQEIRKRIFRMKGVESVEPDLKNSQLSVKGTVTAPQLVQHIHKITGKNAVVVKQEPEPKKEEAGGHKGKEEKKDDDAAEKKEEPKDGGAATEKKEESKDKDEKKDGGGEDAKAEGDPPAAAAGGDEMKGMELRKNEINYYHPGQNFYQVNSARYTAESSYGWVPSIPQMFSDENPNSCSIM